MYGKRIKELLDIRGLDQIDLAKGLKKSPVTISRWVNRAHLSTKEIEQVCKFLNISLIDFFQDDATIAKQFDISIERLNMIKKIDSFPEEIQDRILEDFANCLETIALALKRR